MSQLAQFEEPFSISREIFQRKNEKSTCYETTSRHHASRVLESKPKEGILRTRIGSFQFFFKDKNIHKDLQIKLSHTFLPILSFYFLDLKYPAILSSRENSTDFWMLFSLSSQTTDGWMVLNWVCGIYSLSNVIYSLCLSLIKSTSDVKMGFPIIHFTSYICVFLFNYQLFWVANITVVLIFYWNAKGCQQNCIGKY